MSIQIEKRTDGSLEARVETSQGAYLLDNLNTSHEGQAIYMLIERLYFLENKKAKVKVGL